MANAIKRAARSQRSYRDNKNFRQFIWNAHNKAEQVAKVKFGQMLAEEMRKGKEEKEEKKENE